VLCKLRGVSEDSIDIQYEFKALKAERMVDIEMSKLRYGDQPGSWTEVLGEYRRIFTTKVLLRRLSLGVAINVLGQFSGINGTSLQA